MSNDLQTEIRFWAQVMMSARRTVLCSPDLESRCKGHVEARGLAGLVTVLPLAHMPDNMIIVASDDDLRMIRPSS